jgi:hypothetical protein
MVSFWSQDYFISGQVLTRGEVEAINRVMSHRSWFYTTDKSQGPDMFRSLISGQGHINTGGFDFHFRRTNSFTANGNGWSIHLSDFALFLIVCLILGILAISVIAGLTYASVSFLGFKATVLCVIS